MLSLISSVFGFLMSGLPKVLEYFQDRADKAHELKLANIQTERELALAAQGFGQLFGRSADDRHAVFPCRRS